MIPETGLRVQKFLDEYQAIAEWDTARTERTEDILSLILPFVDGDILEIGAFQGRTTNVFCQVGAVHNRAVHVVDPWDGRQEGNQGAYNKFKTNTSRFTNLTVQRTGSENPKIIEKFKRENLKFAFILIDGDHSYNSIKSDILTYKDLLSQYGVLCIDDWYGPYEFSNGIQRAARDHLDDTYKLLEAPESFIERYFVKLS